MVVMGSYRPRPEWLAVSSLRAKLAKSLKLRTLWRLYLHDTLRKRLAQDLEDVAAALRPCIENEHAMVGERDGAGHWHLSATDQPHIGDRVIKGMEGASGNAVRAPVGTPGDVLDVHGLEALGHTHEGQHRGQTTHMHALLASLCVNLTSMFTPKQLSQPKSQIIYDPLLINTYHGIIPNIPITRSAKPASKSRQ